MNVVNGFKTEIEAIKFFMKQRWNGKVECPFGTCSAESKIYNLKSGKDFKCACCLKVFSYKVGSIFEDSKIQIKKWYTAVYLHTANKKGISSIQLSKRIGVTQKTAWFMLHRIRSVLDNGSGGNNGMFGGINEIDKVCLGGVEKNRHASIKRETAIKEKTVVVGMVNRENDEVSLQKLESTHSYELSETIVEKVEMGSTMITDGFSAYEHLKHFCKHETVNHSAGEYVKEDTKSAFKIHTNTIEGMFSQLKRTILGAYHWFSNKHMQRYLNEIIFRYSTRKEEDSLRFSHSLKTPKGG